jgi:SAM-dependent methyltransferase
LDLGAGTGQLSELLVAADPSTEMLAQLAARLPGVPTLVAGAEALPLADDDVDAVLAGQAAHWFEPAAAGREFRRVLRPGGAVGFVWNIREDSAPWAAALNRLLAAESRDQEGDRPYLDQIRELLATHPDTRARAELDVSYTTSAYRLTPR